MLRKLIILNLNLGVEQSGRLKPEYTAFETRRRPFRPFGRYLKVILVIGQIHVKLCPSCQIMSNHSCSFRSSNVS
jgi:hypothetical protein